MKTTLTHFRASDSVLLPGLLYEPDADTNVVCLFLHGNGSSSVFYKPEINIWGKQFAKRGISFFPFNNRGAHFAKSLKRINDREDHTEEEERIMGGAYYEKIADCAYDINGAIAFLKEKGYKRFFLIGHSTGANKIVLYQYLQKDSPAAGYILLAGGDDTGLSYKMLGRKRFYAALERSLKEIDRRNGAKTVPRYLFPEPYSFLSLYDVLNPDGNYNIFPFYEYLTSKKLSSKPLFCEFKTIKRPTLVVYGEHDEYCFSDVPGCVNALKAHKPTNSSIMSYKVISNTGHGFDAKEELLGETMGDWVTSSLR